MSNEMKVPRVPLFDVSGKKSKPPFSCYTQTHTHTHTQSSKSHLHTHTHTTHTHTLHTHTHTHSHLRAICTHTHTLHTHTHYTHTHTHTEAPCKRSLGCMNPDSFFHTDPLFNRVHTSGQEKFVCT